MEGLDKEWREVLDNNFVVGGVSVELSEGFDSILHDLLITQLKAYGFDNYLVNTFTHI